MRSPCRVSLRCAHSHPSHSPLRPTAHRTIWQQRSAMNSATTLSLSYRISVDGSILCDLTVQQKCKKSTRPETVISASPHIASLYSTVQYSNQLVEISTKNEYRGLFKHDGRSQVQTLESVNPKQKIFQQPVSKSMLWNAFGNYTSQE